MWRIPLGQHPAYKDKPITGTDNYGGPVVTFGGLLFIAVIADSKPRGFNKLTGKLLWEYELPAPAFATPSVFELNGTQYLVIACGVGKMGIKSSELMWHLRCRIWGL